MNNVALAFLTKDKVELSERTIQPLLQPEKFDLFLIDGSDTSEGKDFIFSHSSGNTTHLAVRGGPDAAVVYALTEMLNPTIVEYDYIGLCESDVLLAPDWFDRTMELFAKGERDDIPVGAVSARCYADRILIQQPDYAVVHNHGWGMQIMTREAAGHALWYMRTSLTTENRKTFSQLAGIDIGTYWAFKGNEHFTCADWSNDRILAVHGLASLALTSSPQETAPVTMIGQTPPLAEQGLTLVTEPIEEFRNDAAFERYSARLNLIRAGEWEPPVNAFHHDVGGYTIFPHQVHQIGGAYEGDWRLKWTQGFGPFSWRAVEMAMLTVPVFGPCEFLVGGGPAGGFVEVSDPNGYAAKPFIQSEGDTGMLTAVAVPGTYQYRPLTLRCSPGCTFYGLRVREPQPWSPNSRFDHSVLPPV